MGQFPDAERTDRYATCIGERLTSPDMRAFSAVMD